MAPKSPMLKRNENLCKSLRTQRQVLGALGDFLNLCIPCDDFSDRRGGVDATSCRAGLPEHKNGWRSSMTRLGGGACKYAPSSRCTIVFLADPRRPGSRFHDRIRRKNGCHRNQIRNEYPAGHDQFTEKHHFTMGKRAREKLRGAMAERISCNCTRLSLFLGNLSATRFRKRETGGLENQPFAVRKDDSLD